MKRRFVQGLLVVITFSHFACTFDEVTENEVTQSITGSGSDILRPSELPLVAIANQDSSFGGYYCENGDLIVLSTEGKANEEALRALIDTDTVRSCVRHVDPERTPLIIVAPSKHSFVQLTRWRDAISSRFYGLNGAVSLGIDYRKNLVVLDVRSWALTPANAMTSSVGVPAGAYEIRESGQTATRATLQGSFGPVPGGVQMVSTPNGSYGNDGRTICTMGVATDRFMGDYWQGGWITNSHCVPPRFVNQSRWVFQTWRVYPACGDPSLPNCVLTPDEFVGFEYVDPPYFTCGQPLNSWRCRYSDAAWVWALPQDPAKSPEHGKIARTDSFWGSLTVDNNYQRFSIRSYRGAVQGMEVHKMGRSTGWTWGHVTDVCVDQLDNPDKFLCQDKTDYPDDYGDSGSPVFFWFGGTGTLWSTLKVDLVGIHWGVQFDGAGQPYRRIYSPWVNVTNELGNIFAFDPNHAREGTATASSSEEASGWSLSKVVDTNRNSVPNTQPPWSMGYSSAAGVFGNHVEWLEVRWPSPKSISRVVLYPRNDSGMVGEFFPIDFTIQIWNGTSWIDRVIISGYPKPGNAGQSFTWGGSDVTDRIRIYATNLGRQVLFCARRCTYQYMLQLAEVEVY